MNCSAIINDVEPFYKVDGEREVSIEITNDCELNCKMCSSNAGEKPICYIKLNKLKQIINDATKLGFNTVSLSGGEPFLHPKFDEIVKFIKLKKLNLLVYTCGNIRINHNRVGSITNERLKLLKVIGINRIIFNLQSFNKEIHNNITETPVSHQNVLKSIQRSINEDIFTEVHFVPMIPNYRELNKLVRYLEKVKINRLSILRFVAHGRGEKNSSELKLNLKELKEFKSITKPLLVNKRNLEIRIGTPMQYILNDNPITCSAGLDKLLIRADGFTFPCVSLKHSLEISKDNIYKKDFNEIWTNSNIFKFFRTLNSKNHSKQKECFGQILLKNKRKLNLDQEYIDKSNKIVC